MGCKTWNGIESNIPSPFKLICIYVVLMLVLFVDSMKGEKSERAKQGKEVNVLTSYLATLASESH